MKDRTLRTIIISASYIAGLLLLVIYIKPVLHAISYFIDIFDPFFAGILIAFILNGPCMFVERLLSLRLLKERSASIQRTISIIIIYILFSVLLALGISYLIPALIGSIQDLLKNIDTYSSNLQSLVDKVTHLFGFKKNIDMSNMLDWTAAYADKLAQSVTQLLGHIINLTSEGMTLIASFFFSIVFSVYLLKGKERLLQQAHVFSKHYLPARVYLKCEEIFHVIVHVFGGYFIGQIIEASILCVLCFLGMLAFGFGYPVLISALIGVTSLVPMIGPYIGGIIAFRILVMIDPAKALLFILFIVVLQQLEGYFIYPRIVGRAIGLQGIWVILSIMVGASLGGVTGIVIGVPIAAVLYTLIRQDIHKNRGKGDPDSQFPTT